LRTSGEKSDIVSLLKVVTLYAAYITVFTGYVAINEQVKLAGLTIYRRFRAVKTATRESGFFGEGGVCKVVLAIDTEFHGELSKRLVGAFAPIGLD
jgi:hypothetical protein